MYIYIYVYICYICPGGNITGNESQIRAPLVLQRAAVLRSSRNISTSAPSTKTQQQNETLIDKTISNIDVINDNEVIIEKDQINENENEMIDIKQGRVEGRVEGRDKGREKGRENGINEETKDNFMVLALLKKAEGLLTSINSVTKYVDPQSSSNIGYSDSKYTDSNIGVHPGSITTYVNPDSTPLRLFFRWDVLLYL
jgi:hypothetical protein